jgi:hypothetical protein
VVRLWLWLKRESRMVCLRILLIVGYGVLPETPLSSLEENNLND